MGIGDLGECPGDRKQDDQQSHEDLIAVDFSGLVAVSAH